MREKVISIVIIIVSALAPILILPSEYGNYNIPKLIVLLYVGILLLILLLANYKKIYIDKVDILLLIFGALVFLSTIFSSNIITSIIGADNRYEGMLMFFIYILIFFSAKKFLKKEYLNAFVKVMYIVFFIICTLAIFQHYIAIDIAAPIFSSYKAPSGTFGNSNFLGSFVSIGLPIFTTAFIINGKKRNLILSCMIFAGVIVCIARSSWVASIIYLLALIVFLIYKRDKKYFKRFLIVLVAFTCICLVLSVNLKVNKNIIQKKDNMLNEIKQMLTIGIRENNGSGRIAIWKITLKLTLRNPILGVGTDNLREGLYNDSDIRENELHEFVYRTHTTIDKAHNEYLHIAATIGIPALIIYLLFLCIIFFKNLRYCFKDNAKLILLLSILAYLAQAFFNISTIGVAPLFWLMLGIISNEEILEELNKKLS